MNQKRPSKAASMAVLSRVVRYMLRYYKIPFILVVVCILITAIATVVGATFPQTLVDDYITPMVQSGSTDFSGLAAQLFRLACIMAVGVVTAFTYNRIMVTVSQGTMRRLRDDLFRRMESLPIKYFDTATLCRCTPTTWTPCAKCSARAFPKPSTRWFPWRPPW